MHRLVCRYQSSLYGYQHQQASSSVKSLWNVAERSMSVLGGSRPLYAKAAKQNSQQQQDSDANNSSEIKVTIPSLSREQIFHPRPVVKLEKWKPEMATMENVNRVTQVPEEFMRIMSEFRLTTALREEFQFFGRAALLTRRCLLQLIDCIQQQFQAPVSERRHFVLRGNTGIGKSATMLQLASYFQQKENMIVIPQPNVVYWLHGKFPFTLNSKTGLYEQPEAACHFLTKLQQINAISFPKSLLAEDHNLSEAINLKAGKNTIAELVKCGAEDVKLASAVFNGLLRELAHSETPVLLCLDGYNGYFIDSKYFDAESRPINAQQFSLIHGLSQLATGSQPMKNGVFVGALSTWILGERPEAAAELLVNRQMKQSKYEMISVPRFTPEETMECLKYYARGGLLDRAEITPLFLDKCQFMSGGIPKEVYRYCVERHLL